MIDETITNYVIERLFPVDEWIQTGQYTMLVSRLTRYVNLIGKWENVYKGV